jgi:GTP pyrophosphokinase
VDCRNLKNAHTERAIEVSWGAIPLNKRYVARLKLDASDRSGLFADIAQAIMAAEGGIVGIKASVVGGNIARMKVEIKVRNLEHLYAVIARLNTVKNVIEITRG